MRLLGGFILVVLFYFLGNLSTGQLVAARSNWGMDIRKFGSGSSGATNVLRVLGAGPALLTFAGDFLKGVAAALVGNWIGGMPLAALCGFAVIIGHIWPVLTQFKGGKGVATAAGVFLVLSPGWMLVALAAAIAVIIATRYVSLGSLLGVALFFLLCGVPGLLQHAAWRFLFCAATLAVVLYAHRENVKRLLNGKENATDLSKFTSLFGKNGSL